MLDLSALTTLAGSTTGSSQLFIEAHDGGRVDLSGVTDYAAGTLVVLAEDAGSVVDFSALAVATPGQHFGMTSSLTASAGGTVLLNPATTAVTDINVIVTETGTLRGGTLSLGAEAQLSGTGTLEANVVNDAGTTAPGSSIGTLAVDGTYSQNADGVLLIELDVESGQSDMLAVAGDASLGGTLRIGHIGNFDPANDWTYTILTADGAIPDPFDRLVGPIREIVYNDHEIVVTTTYMGDATLDLCVADYDLSVLLSNWWELDPSTITAWQLGDFTGDGIVYHDDLAVLLANWTGPCPAIGTAVPGPTSVVLLMIAAPLAAWRRRHR